MREDYARSFLNDVSYFRLIKAYSLGLKERNGNYHKNVCFEDKKAVSEMFGVCYTYFESWVESIAYVRNVCAHYDIVNISLI